MRTLRVLRAVCAVWSAGDPSGDLALLLFSPGDVLSCEREEPSPKGGRYLLPT